MARLLIGAGGTGGHVYPALAVAEALRKSEEDEHNLVFVGTRGGGGFERLLVEQSQVQFDEYIEIFAGPIVGVNPFRALMSIILMVLGVFQSFRALMRHRPQAILLTGGWANVPIAVVGWLWRTPMLVYLPDVEPGRTIQLLGKLVRRVAITVPESARYFRTGQAVVTGYPLRDHVAKSTRAIGLELFELDPMRRTILVTGGSRGARSINQAIENILTELLQQSVQVIHVTGRLDWERSRAQARDLSAGNNHYHAFPYLETDQMGPALAAADIIVGRSGASALGEFPYFGAVSILVPYPYAWRYQKTNADWLEKHGAAIRVNDEEMASKLLPVLLGLLEDDIRLAKFRENALALNMGNGADNIARELRELAGA